MNMEVDQEHREFSTKDSSDPLLAPFIDADELTKWSLYRATVAEFTATLLFLYITVSTVIGYKRQIFDPENNYDPCEGVGILGIAWAFGGMIFVLVYCNAGISGAHINPAITFGFFLARRMSLVRTLLYIVAQILGGICGCGLAKAFQNDYVKYGGAVNVLSRAYGKGTGLGVEIIGTFVLVYTVFSAIDPKRNECKGLPCSCTCFIQVLAPLPIGFVVVMVHLATIPITGTGINPARSFGAAVIYNNERAWHDHWIFWCGPFTGAAAAAFYHHYKVIFGSLKNMCKWCLHMITKYFESISTS